MPIIPYKLNKISDKPDFQYLIKVNLVFFSITVFDH